MTGARCTAIGYDDGVAKEGLRRLTVGYKPDQFDWLHEEADRRGWSVGQLVRHCVEGARRVTQQT